jgi:hypothetical protein
MALAHIHRNASCRSSGLFNLVFRCYVFFTTCQLDAMISAEASNTNGVGEPFQGQSTVRGLFQSTPFVIKAVL